MHRKSKKINIAVLFGGKSGEHEVSLASATSVIKNLDSDKYNITPIGITKKGTWVVSTNSLSLLKLGQVNNRKSNQILAPDSTKKNLVVLSGVKRGSRIDVVFPVLHGTYGEDGTIQGLFEMANIPYVGANVLASAVGMDKIIQKQLLREIGLPVVTFLYFKKNEYQNKRSEINKQIKKLGFPVFIKPANGGSSVGISKVKSTDELHAAIKNAFQYDLKIIIEKSVEHAREIEVAVLGNDSPRATVPGEIVTSGDFYDYSAKYIDGKSRAVIPAKLNKSTIRTLQKNAVAAYRAIDCSGMARIDFLISKLGKIFISEVNTIPGFTSISMYPKLWEASGMPFPKLLDTLVELALERHQKKSLLATTFHPRKNWYS